LQLEKYGIVLSSRALGTTDIVYLYLCRYAAFLSFQ